MKWINRYDGGPHEANFLKLDCSKLKTVFDWKPVWNLEGAIGATVEWSKCMRDGGDVAACMDKQIAEFASRAAWIAK
jgi:CDP-glucose 4,6-dehydratase